MPFYVFTFYALTLYSSDGPDNLCEPISAVSKNPVSAIWSSRQCLSVLGSLLCTFHNLSNSWVCGTLPSSSEEDFRGAHLHFRENTFSKFVTTFNNHNHMWFLLLIWWQLTILKLAGATIWTLNMDMMWLLTLLIVLFLLFAPCICNCVAEFVSSHMKAFKLQMVAQTTMTAATSSNYYLGPLDQRPSIWGLRGYVTSLI